MICSIAGQLSKDEAISSFEQQGFLINQRVFGADVITAAKSGVFEVLSGIYDTGTAPQYLVDVNHPRAVNRIGQIHYANGAIAGLVCAPAIGRLVAMLTGARWVKLWGSQLYFKPGRQAAADQIGCHRDAQHLPGIAGGGLTVWIPLTPMGRDSGTLIYLSGSHQSKGHIRLPGAQDPDVQQQLTDFKRSFGHDAHPEYPLYLSPGDLSIHHQDTIHASLCNLSSQPRIAMAVSIVTDKTTYTAADDVYGIVDIINNPGLAHEYRL